MERKVYYNEKLEEMLNRYIREEKYGGFKPLLNEIFQRRAYEFGFDNRHMKKEIRNFVKRLKKIEFAKNVPKIDQYVPATYYRYVKYSNIYFNCESNALTNKDMSDLDYLMLYGMLTHEVYHGISDKWIYVGLIEGKKGIPMNEIVVESAVHRTVYSRTSEDNQTFRAKTNAYSDITFVANLLATSFEIEERELLKGGLQNRKEFQKAFKKYISDKDYQNDVLFHFDILESNLDFLYNALYGREKNPTDSEVIVSSLTEIYSQIYSIANVCVSKSTRKINQEYAEELAYDFSKIRTIIGTSLETFVRNGNITEEMANELLQEVWSNSLGYLSKVSDILVLTNQKSKITDKSVWQEMERLAKDGELINHAEEFGIEAGKNPTTRYKIIEYHKKTNHEFDNPTQWDNEYVIEIMKQLWNEREVVDVAKLEQELDTITIAQKIKDFITQFKNRNLLKLEKGEKDNKETIQYKDLETNFDEECKVSEEELKPRIENPKIRKFRKQKERE